MVIKLLNFVNYSGYEDPTFYLGMYSISKESTYAYLDVPFRNDLSLKPIIAYMKYKVQKSLYLFSSFLTTMLIPLSFKKYIIQSYIISKALYFAPLLGSNMTNTNKVQYLINTSLLWCNDSSSSIKENDSVKINEKKSHKKYYIKRNSTVSTYVLSRDLQNFPIAGSALHFNSNAFLNGEILNVL